MKKIFLLLSAILVVFFAGCNLNSDDEKGGNPHDEMLQDLGVDTDLGDREDPNGKSLSEDYNPIGPQVGILFKQCEIYAAGVGYGDHDNVLFEDLDEGSESGTVLFQEEDDADFWDSGHPKSSIAADVDGDGYDEIVISVFYFANKTISLRLLDIDDGDTESSEIVSLYAMGTDLEDELTGTAGGSDNWEDAFLRQDLASGDIDGDGKDELVLVEARHVFVLDDGDTGFNILHKFTTENLNSEVDSYIRVALGDLDMDGLDEIVLTNGEDSSITQAEYTIYDDIVTDPDMNSPLMKDRSLLTTNPDGKTVHLRASGVTTGDFDGDGLVEVAFGGKRGEGDDDPDGYAYLILDASMTANSEVEFDFLAASHGDNNEKGYLIPPMDAGDIDGDGADELVVWDDIFHVNDSGEIYHDSEWGSDALTEDLAGNRNDEPDIDILAVGDVTGDMKDDVVFLSETGDILRIVYAEDATQGGDLAYSDISVGDAPSRPTLCLPNVDDDSAVLEYLEHELLFTDPVVIAVIASPPYWDGINGSDQGYEGSTEFGYSVEQSTTEEDTYGFSTGFSFGAEFEAPFGLASAEVETSVEESFNWGVATTHTVTESWGYVTGLGEDKVLFTAIPFDVYYYEVLNSPETSQIGERVTINVPRAPEQNHFELSYYNEMNSDGYDVTDSVKKHTVGEPLSYHSEDEKDALIESSDTRGFFSETSAPIGVSSTGTSYIALDVLESQEDNYEYDLEVEISAEIGVGGITAGTSSGYSYGYSYTTSYTTGTHIYGEVPDVPDSEYKYNWGLMAYPVEEDDQAYTMVTYWTDSSN